jgi:hypothetical protein
MKNAAKIEAEQGLAALDRNFFIKRRITTFSEMFLLAWGELI